MAAAQAKQSTIDDEIYAQDIENILKLFKVPERLSPIHDLSPEEMNIPCSNTISDGMTEPLDILFSSRSY